MDVLYDRVAGLDIGKETLTVCVPGLTHCPLTSANHRISSHLVGSLSRNWFLDAPPHKGAGSRAGRFEPAGAVHLSTGVGPGGDFGC